MLQKIEQFKQKHLSLDVKAILLALEMNTFPGKLYA
jgi:hypothetical protein